MESKKKKMRIDRKGYYVCSYCIHALDNTCHRRFFCDGHYFKPVAEILPNLWNGSTAQWELSWQRTRRLVFYRDRSKCKRCGKSLSFRDKHGFEVHHLRRREYGGTNNPRNLILLCQECHKQFTASYTEKEAIKEANRRLNGKYWKKLGIKEVID